MTAVGYYYVVHNNSNLIFWPWVCSQ